MPTMRQHIRGTGEAGGQHSGGRGALRGGRGVRRGVRLGLGPLRQRRRRRPGRQVQCISRAVPTVGMRTLSHHSSWIYSDLRCHPKHGSTELHEPRVGILLRGPRRLRPIMSFCAGADVATAEQCMMSKTALCNVVYQHPSVSCRGTSACEDLASGSLPCECPHRYLPTQARGDLEGRKCLAVACGWRHSMVVDSEGCVFTWGWGSYGQLGLNGKTCASPASSSRNTCRLRGAAFPRQQKQQWLGWCSTFSPHEACARCYGCQLRRAFILICRLGCCPGMSSSRAASVASWRAARWSALRAGGATRSQSTRQGACTPGAGTKCAPTSVAP